MNKKEKRTILEAAIDRAYTAIAETPGAEMKDERFGDLLFRIDQLEHIASRLGGGEEGQQKATESVGDPNLCPGPSDAGTAKESSAVEPAEPEQTPAEGETETETETETEEPTTYTKEEVKSALARARVKGVNAVAVLRQVGADSFQTLTSNKYAEVMRIIEQELANAS